MSTVNAYNEKKTIRTYLIGDTDINPFISEYLGSLMFYPYPLKNKIFKEVKEVEYNLFCLENDFIKMTILPDLGGKLYSAVDKRSNQDIFYCNPVVKPQLVGCTGAWTSGGVEFNFPNRGHRPTATDYTDTMFKTYQDGSASITICDIDMISWQWFTVELRLYPGKAYIEQIVRMYNTNDYYDSCYFWTTSAELEKPGLEYRFPFLWHIEEESRKKYLWPYAEDGPFAAEGVDLRFCDTMKAFTLPFGSEVLKDYVGIYYPDTDSGVVHVADFRQVPGKKVWAWGNASAGVNWCKRLTDNDERYIELQAGAVETQNEFKIIEPHNKIELCEYWLYSNGNGPLCAASKEVIASYKMEDDALLFSFIATDCYQEAEFTFMVADQIVWQQKIDLDAIKNTKLKVPFKTEWMDYDLSFTITNSQEVLLQETILDNGEALEMIEREEYVSKDEVRESECAQALALEKRRHYNEAIALYLKVIKENPQYVQAYVRLATCYLKKHDPETALRYLEQILTGNPEETELIYVYALALWHTGERYKAVKYFYKVPLSSKLFAAASYFIALYHVGKREYEKALAKLDYITNYQPYHYKSVLLKAYILTLTQKKCEAGEILDKYLEANPLDYIGMYLRDEIYESQEHSKLIFGQRQNIYRLLGFFDELCDWKRCAAIVTKHTQEGGSSALLSSYQYYYLDLLEGGHRQELIAAVNNISLDYVFPNHPVDLKILRSLLTDSSNAKYLYGLLQYRAENYNLVKQVWGELLNSDFSYSVLYRNLAYYYQRVECDLYKAQELAEKGLEKKPFNDYFFYVLYTSYRALGLEEQIISLLRRIEKFESKTEPCRRVWIDMLNHLGQHDQAVQVLEDTEFMIFEHDPADLIPYPKIFRESYLGLARMALREKNYIQAWAAVEKCLNMERRYEENCAEIYFYAGLIQEKRGDFQKALIFYERILAENISKEDKANYQFRVKAAHRIVKLNWIGIK